MVVEVSWEVRMRQVYEFHLDQYQKALALHELGGILYFPNRDSRDLLVRQWERANNSFGFFRDAFRAEPRSSNGFYSLKNHGLQFQAVLIPFLNSCRDIADFRIPAEDEIEAVSGELASMELVEN